MEIQYNRDTESWPNVITENTAQRNENYHAGSQHDTTTIASISSEGDRESFIRHWREAQTGQPAAGRTLDIPRGRQTIGLVNKVIETLCHQLKYKCTSI